MTPQEKANEMLEIMTPTGARYFCNEILQLIEDVGNNADEYKGYWEDVKYEVEN